MKKLFLFLFLTSLMNCGNGDVTDKIAQLEKEHSETPTTEIKQRLLAKYQIYLKELESDIDAFTDISQKTATLQMDLNQYPAAANTLKNALAKKATAENVGMLAYVTVNHLHPNNFENAVADFQTIYADTAQMKSAVQPLLTELQNELMKQYTGDGNREKVNYFISMARLQAAIVKNDKNAEEMLFSAATIADALKKYKAALEIYDYILAHPDDFSKVPTALFFKGFINDDRLKNLEEAERVYNEFLEKYPENDYAESVKASINNLGKSAAEIIESFEKD